MIKIILAVMMLTFSSCNKSDHDWYVIFDGKDVKGMRGYNMESFPWNSWEVDNNSLKTIPGTHGVDIISMGWLTHSAKNLDVSLELTN